MRDRRDRSRRARGSPVDEDALLRMARAIRHRGPDGYGLALDDGAGLVSDSPGDRRPARRLAAARRRARTGTSSSTTARSTTTSSCASELARRGESRSTRRATPRWSCGCSSATASTRCDRLNGQFAFAWWQAGAATADPRPRPLRRPPAPLTRSATTARSSSARRPRRCSPPARSRPEPDLGGIDDVFTLWGPRAPRSRVSGRRPARARAACSSGSDGKIVARKRWWEPEYGDATAPDGDLRSCCATACDLRLRADVPVGAYLSGGLDSSLITALAQQRKAGELRTFSIAFKDPRYDERGTAGGGRARPSDSAPRRRGRARRDRGGASRRRPARRDPADPHRSRAAVPARARRARERPHRRDRPARAPTSSSGATTCSRRSRSASCTGATRTQPLAMLDDLYPYLGETGAGAARRSPIPARDRRRRRSARLPPDPGRGDGDREGVLPRRGRRRDRRGCLARAAARRSSPRPSATGARSSEPPGSR